MINKFKVTVNQQLLVSSQAWIKYGILICMYVYIFGFKVPPSFIYLFIVIFFIDLLPAIILHIQYLLKNGNSVLVINRNDNTINYRNANKNLVFNFDEIVCFNYVTSYGGGKSAAGFYAFGDYRFCQIGLKDNTEIIITCLMVHDLQNTLEMLLRMKSTKKSRVFPFISKQFFFFA